MLYDYVPRSYEDGSAYCHHRSGVRSWPLYYSPVNASDAAEGIYKVATDGVLRKQLVENGIKQLQKFDTYEQRAEKLIGILEEIKG